LVLHHLVGHEDTYWTVTRLWVSDITDIVAMQLTPLSESSRAYNFSYPMFDLLPPAVGDRVHAFGYHEHELRTAADGTSTVHTRAASTHGNVVEVHDFRRDNVLLPFPCFRTNARFDGGISGGPVLNSAGQIVGLVCSTYPPTNTGEEDASYAVLLWPATAILIDLERPGQPPGFYPLFDLFRDKSAGYSDRLELTRLPDGGTRLSLRIPNERRTAVGTEKGQSDAQPTVPSTKE